MSGPVLYHCHNARSLRPLWTMEELGLDYELRPLPFPPRIHNPDFLQENPLGTVPLFVDVDVRMTESVAICEYLVARHGPTSLRVTEREKDYGLYLNWLYFGEATLTFPQTLVLRYGQLEPPERRNPQIVTDYTRWFLARLRAVEARVSKFEFLCADRFTIADISVGYALLLAEDLTLNDRFTPVVTRYLDRLKARDGFLRAQSATRAEGSCPPSRNAGKCKL